MFVDNIKGIVKEVTKNATATADDILKGKTAWVNGEEIIGTGTGNSYTDMNISCIASSKTGTITCPEDVNVGLFFICTDSSQDVTKISSVNINGSGSATQLTHQVSSNTDYGHHMVLSIYKLENITANTIITISGQYLYSANTQIVKLPNSITNISVINTNTSRNNFSGLEATTKIDNGIVFSGAGTEQTSSSISYIAGTCGKVTMLNESTGTLSGYNTYTTSAIARVEKVEAGAKFYSSAYYPRAAGLQIISFD